MILVMFLIVFRNLIRIVADFLCMLWDLFGMVLKSPAKGDLSLSSVKVFRGKPRVFARILCSFLHLKGVVAGFVASGD